ncbi:iron complex outermembrane receptor protein [Sphingomonas naasensis]|uniref:TonB-dependent receptor n=1 Tax=Sphingomonas naasensis TaxID=1344951 RepID=A0A4S1WMU2_9SPHN|nr:TonB-dependent receptor [Sphingomonas naasensis]NIJ20516.1 iron complex outermembrane receptor protein [Sphingomonas naasensis]TGX44604.1 TonB-dependent receptor [Sphingomonas naasensis]
MRISLCCLSLLATPEAWAQQAQPVPAPVPQGRDVVRAADDAFGRRVGIEDVGLYSESEVRGFDLQSAGNYRIEDHYFVRAIGLPLTLIDGTAIRVGANGLRTDFAAPSGVVQYDLPDVAPGTRARVETGWWGGSGPVLSARVTTASADGDLGLVGSIQANPLQDYTDGTGGDFFAAGIVPRWSPLPGVKLTGMYGRTWFERGGDTVFATTDGTPPPEVVRGPERSQPWMEQRTETTQAGLIADVDAGRGWAFGASAFLSRVHDQRTYFNLIRFPAGGGPVEESAQAFGNERFRSLSGEVTAAKSFATGVIAMVRRRDSLASMGPGTALPLVRFADVDAPVAIPKPGFEIDPRRKRDTVGQWAGGVGYRLSIGSAAELRADVQRAHYTKTVRALDGSETRETTRPWLYSAAITGAITPDLTVFASYARGLEEAGVAPGNAANRGAVLPAALSRQAELGLKYRIPGGPTLIAGLFDLSKPLPGLDANGVYGFVGEVRHRGVELSLAGPITGRLSAVLGATLLDAQIGGELVDAGVIGSHPIGRPEAIALANLTWRVPGVEGLAIDGGVNFRGQRYANRENSATLPSYAIFHAGLRQRFEVEGQPLTVRARVTNLLDKFVWNASNAGLFTPNGKRVVTLTVTGEI